MAKFDPRAKGAKGGASACKSFISLAFFTLGLHKADAGSAVALGPHNQMVASYGHTREIAKQRALDQARRRYGDNVRILASSATLMGIGLSAFRSAIHRRHKLIPWRWSFV